MGWFVVDGEEDWVSWKGGWVGGGLWCVRKRVDGDGGIGMGWLAEGWRGRKGEVRLRTRGES